MSIGYNRPGIITCAKTNFDYTLSYLYGNGYWTAALRDSISTGELNTSGSVVKYGEAELSDVDCITWYEDDSINRSICHWNDGTSDYTFHVYDSGATHYASFATNSPDVFVQNGSFSVVKDFDLRTVTNKLNSLSDKYVLQPVVAFGIKQPIYLITGANGAEAPLFSEIEAGGTGYFVIGTNYCVKM